MPICRFIGLLAQAGADLSVYRFIGLSAQAGADLSVYRFIGISAQAGADLSVYRFIGLSAQAGKNRPCHHAALVKTKPTTSQMTSCVPSCSMLQCHNSFFQNSERCQVPVPYAFSCRDLDVWGRFLDLLQRNAAEGEKGKR